MAKARRLKTLGETKLDTSGEQKNLREKRLALKVTKVRAKSQAPKFGGGSGIQITHPRGGEVSPEDIRKTHKAAVRLAKSDVRLAEKALAAANKFNKQTPARRTGFGTRKRFGFN